MKISGTYILILITVFTFFILEGCGGDSSGSNSVYISASAVSVGDTSACAVITGGTVQCWGSNGAGQLGNGTTTNSLTPVTVTGISTAKAISSGTGMSCALISGGTIQCWGYNGYGQLGNGTTTNSSVPASVSGISTAVSLSVGGTQSACAVLTNGSVRCWGLNTDGQLGNGTTTSSSIPVSVSGISTATSVSVSPWYSACALLANGSVQCWGDNETGQLGNGTVSLSSSTPVAVRGISTAIAVAAGSYFTCALLSGGTVQCWGDNGGGQFGNGTTTNSLTPVTVTGITTAIAISAGEGAACALLANGTIQCWGANDTVGALGNGTNSQYSTIPVTVSNINSATEIYMGNSNSSCALLANGMIKCWGWNGFGQLGNGTTIDSWSPVSVKEQNPGTTYLIPKVINMF